MSYIDDIRASFRDDLENREVVIIAFRVDSDTRSDVPAISLTKNGSTIGLSLEDWDRAIVLIEAIKKTIHL